MKFEFSDKVQGLMDRVSHFMEEHVYPAEKEYHDFIEQAEKRWTIPPISRLRLRTQ